MKNFITIIFCLFTLSTNNSFAQNNQSKNIELPQTDVMSEIQFAGTGTNSKFGSVTSSAGDVNGDGFNDVIISAYGYQTNTGRVYIYYGGLNMNPGSDVILTGSTINNYFGYSVSGAGDVNGDGFDDVIVGEYGYSTNKGRILIYFGGNSMNASEDVILTGEFNTNNFGYSVSHAGDVNGDGFGDVMVGANGFNNSAGKVYIYFGGTLFDNVPDVTFTGENNGDNLGYSVTGAGDVNGDGFPDVIAGATDFNSFTGRAYLLFGGFNMDNIVDVTFTGEAAFSNFGSDVADAGDVNFDGYNDVIVSASAFNSNTGKVYVYLGGTNMNNVSDATMTGEDEDHYFGISVSSAGDLNGDSFSDILIGADNINSQQGKAYLFFGSNNINSETDVFFTGELLGIKFAHSVASAGDVNNDGYGDIIIGAPGYGSNTGRAYLYQYKMTGLDIPDLRLSGPVVNSYFGDRVSDAGDVNGDGFSDVIVGAQGFNGNTGRAYLFFGGINSDNVPDVIFTGESTGDLFGTAVSGAGDVNGDGYDDVIVGAHNFGSASGKAYTYLGGVNMDNIADGHFYPNTPGNFGYPVSDAGDVNGDGYDDVIVGSYNVNLSYIFFGGQVMDSNVDVLMSGGTGFGFTVSPAGDVNNDGYSDVIVGTYNAGIASIFFGGENMDASPDINLSCGGTSYSATDAGDVNADGYNDIITGSFSSNGTGRAYIYYGGNYFDDVADVIFNGEAQGSYFGISTDKAGDLNGDGYDDVIIGSHHLSNLTGKAYIFFGGQTMDNNFDIYMNGKNTSDRFGITVSSAGDFNGDGVPDVIVGAITGDDGGVDFGSAHLFLSSTPSVIPKILFVSDVPNDEGGKVSLKWMRSGYDLQGMNRITDYYIEKSIPPSGSIYFWEHAATVAATKNSFYSQTINTLYDSSANTNGKFYYRVTARTSNPNEYWRSNIMSGYSVDNLPPVIVSAFNASLISNNVKLTWNRNHEGDLKNYLIYRNTSPEINVNVQSPFGTTTDSLFTDTNPMSGLYYYFISAQDTHYNKSQPVSIESPNITVNVNLLIEGFYDENTSSQISDTVSAYLRNAIAPYNTADFTKAVVSDNGSVTLKFAYASSGNYYIVIKHRNSIGTWSKSGGENIVRGVNFNYDFTTSQSQAFGNNLKPLGNIFCIYSGDADQDESVDLADVILIYNDANNFVTGYKVTDINGDGSIDLSDMMITYNNANSYISVIAP